MHKKGLILVDVIIALSLASVFAVIITESSSMSREIFDDAQKRNEAMDSYETGVNASTSEKLFGNDLVEIDSSINFISSRSIVTGNLFASAGTPFCAADFARSNSAPVGSYQFIRNNGTPVGPIALTATITPIILPIDPSIPLTGLQVRHGTAYISTDSTKSSDPDIIIADIHDPDADGVVIYSEISTGPGIASLALAGKQLYAAQTSRIAQLQVVRVQGLGGPILESAYKLPLPYATATPPLASSIFYDRQKIYLGTEKWDGEEFNIIDVSNPAKPVKIGGLEIGSKINGILIREDVAYVASSDEKQLRVINISDPDNPREIASFGPSGWERQEGNAISYFEGALQFGRTSGGFNIARDHEVFSWATVQSMSGLISADIPGGVYGIIADRSRTYLATRQTDRELQILDRGLSTTTEMYLPLPVAPKTLTCDNDKLYLLSATAPVIYQISLSEHE